MRFRLSVLGLLLLLVSSSQGVVGAPPASAAPTDPDAPILVHIAGIRMVGPEQVMLILADENEERAVPIAVGRDQGIAIYMGKEKAEVPRPMTHDLLVSVLKVLGGTVEKVTVTELREETYYAVIALRVGRTLHSIDARPSDAIALAVRLDAPMYSAPDLLRPLGDQARPEVTARADGGLGLSVQPLDRDLAEFLGAAKVTGVLVASVAAGSPADKAGIRRGDIIRAIDGRATESLADFHRAIDGQQASKFTVWRDGKALTIVRP
jgi:uncharacterized protein